MFASTVETVMNTTFRAREFVNKNIKKKKKGCFDPPRNTNTKTLEFWYGKCRAGKMREIDF